MKPAIDLESIENRMVIRNAVQRGDIETAVGWVNELDPEVSHSFFWTFVGRRRGRRQSNDVREDRMIGGKGDIEAI